jgi:hypothetical protein
LQINIDVLGLTLRRSFVVINGAAQFWIDMTEEIYFALSQRIYRIGYRLGERLTLTLCTSEPAKP